MYKGSSVGAHHIQGSKRSVCQEYRTKRRKWWLMRSEGLLESDCVALYPILSILDFLIRTSGTIQSFKQ